MAVSRVSVPHDDVSVWLTNFTCIELCGCWSDEEAMCVNYEKGDTETDNDNSDKEETVHGYGVL